MTANRIISPYLMPDGLYHGVEWVITYEPDERWTPILTDDRGWATREEAVSEFKLLLSLHLVGM